MSEYTYISPIDSISECYNSIDTASLLSLFANGFQRVIKLALEHLKIRTKDKYITIYPLSFVSCYFTMTKCHQALVCLCIYNNMNHEGFLCPD